MTIKRLFYLFILAALLGLAGCSGNSTTDKQLQSDTKKVGVLLVNHGSRSETWRNALLDLDKRVRDSILKDGRVSDVRTAFMEYNEPSIATRLREFDKAGITDVILIPVFLTVSSHS